VITPKIFSDGKRVIALHALDLGDTITTDLQSAVHATAQERSVIARMLLRKGNEMQDEVKRLRDDKRALLQENQKQASEISRLRAEVDEFLKAGAVLATSAHHAIFAARTISEVNREALEIAIDRWDAAIAAARVKGASHDQPAA
jgi:hypothetical protein